MLPLNKFLHETTHFANDAKSMIVLYMQANVLWNSYFCRLIIDTVSYTHVNITCVGHYQQIFTNTRKTVWNSSKERFYMKCN